MLDLFCTSNVQGREVCRHDFMKYTFNIVMCQDTCELICFKLGMMLYTTKLYSLIPVWSTLIFTQGHWVTESYNFCNHSVIKLHEETQMFTMVDFVRKMTVKKSYKYGEYRLFEHLLLLLLFIFIFCPEQFPCLLNANKMAYLSIDSAHPFSVPFSFFFCFF